MGGTRRQTRRRPSVNHTLKTTTGPNSAKTPFEPGQRPLRGIVPGDTEDRRRSPEQQISPERRETSDVGDVCRLIGIRVGDEIGQQQADRRVVVAEGVRRGVPTPRQG